MIRGINSS